MSRSFFSQLFVYWIFFLSWNHSSFAVCNQHLAVIAHRGNSAEFPENTLAAFQSAIDMGVDFIELDVHLSADGVPYVIHDQTIIRTTDSDSAVEINQLSFEEIADLDAGSWFDREFANEKLPTLEEVLQLPLGNTGVMIEIKEGSFDTNTLAKAVASLVRKYSQVKIGNPIVTGSISPEIVVALRNELPELPIIAIVEDPKKIPDYRPARPNLYAVYHDILDKKLIGELQSGPKVIWVFTVDQPTKMYLLSKMGVDGIITNRPKALLELRAKLAEHCYDVINTYPKNTNIKVK